MFHQFEESKSKAMRVEERSWKILRSISLWLAVGAIIMESFGEALESSTGKKETMTTAKEQSFTEDGLVRLKLIPFHAQRRRLRRERQLRRLQGEDIPDESFFDEEDVLLQNRPHQYPRRRLQETSKQVAELLQGYGTHYVDLWVGSGTPQRQTVIVDTGSGVTAFPCSGCDNCGVPKYHSDGLFDQDKSSTFRPLTCDECMQGHCYSGRCSISMSYQEGSSWSAFEAEDQCYAGGLHSDSVTLDPNVVQDDLNPFLASNFAFPLKFGCQTRLTGLFITQVSHLPFVFVVLRLFPITCSLFSWPSTKASGWDHGVRQRRLVIRPTNERCWCNFKPRFLTVLWTSRLGGQGRDRIRRIHIGRLR